MTEVLLVDARCDANILGRKIDGKGMGRQILSPGLKIVADIAKQLQSEFPLFFFWEELAKEAVVDLWSATYSYPNLRLKDRGVTTLLLEPLVAPALEALR